MSDPGTTGTSILLPPAAVEVYSHDPATLEAARNLAQDWRFARVSLQVREGDVDTAINIYAEHKSPQLVIIQTDTIDESFTGKLESLATNCSEGTSAIVIGPVNDVYLYRRLIEMGVSDYLVKPVETPVLAEVISKSLVQQMEVTGSRLIVFIGAKGGAGTSALAQASAWCISDILGQKTLLMDGAGGASVLSVGFGFTPSTTLAEAARAAANNDEDSLKRMLFKAGDRLSVLASGGEIMLENAITPEQFERLVDTLMVKYPVIIADMSNAAPELKKIIIGKAASIIVVSTPHLPSLRLARALIHEIKDMRGGEDKNIEFIVNMQGMAAKNEVPRKDIEKAMDFVIAASVPFAPKAFIESESEGKKFLSSKEGEDIARAHILPLFSTKFSAGSTLKEAAAGKNKADLLGSFLGKFKAKE
ncbi:MAG: AAA family ATPase [Alphaproteobacteria bacterium]